ncbi:MAG: AAA family ATPase [Phycisphaerae bacterium]|nr:AAA family ATPase [Phycisphaerae bacterium]
MNDQEKLVDLVKGRHPCITIITREENYARQLLAGVAMNCGLDFYSWSVTEGLKDGMVKGSEPVKGTEHPAAAMVYLAQVEGTCIVAVYDIIEHLGDSRTLRTIRELIHLFERNNSTLILVDHNNDIPAAIQSYTTRFEISLPDEDELGAIVRQTLKYCNQERPIKIDITRKGLTSIIRNLRGLTRRQAEQIIYDVVANDNCFDNTDINRVVAHKRQLLQSDGLLEYIETPAELNEIGGLRRLKRWLQLRQDAMTEDAEKYGLLPPRGVLMLGVQGAGKSLCAKAIATAWHYPLLRLDPSVLYNKYIGESERRLKASLRQAEMMAPIVLWIDEIEKAFASAASQSNDGGLSRRMFGTLLTWMQEHKEHVFLVATANDIEALPPELLRKGRFDEIFFVDLPSEEVRKDIFKIHIKKRNRDPEKFDIDALAKQAKGFSGAEIEQAVISGLHRAYSTNIEVDTDAVLTAIKESPPLSVTMSERIDDLRDWAKNRCVPADDETV